MSRLAVFSAITFFTLFAYSYCGEAAEFSVEATFSDPFPLKLKHGKQKWANVDFGHGFSSISRVCVTSTFDGDLADPGETVYYGPFDNSRYGWTNVSNGPIASRTVCSTTASESEGFMDGDESFAIEMYAGEATLAGLTVEVTGKPKEVSGFLGISIKLGLGEGEVSPKGGKVNYLAEIFNSSTSIKRNIYKWSVLTFPSGESYSVDKSKKLRISNGQTKIFDQSKLNIPSWFPSGKYSYRWYLADPANSRRILMSDGFTFNKLTD